MNRISRIHTLIFASTSLIFLASCDGDTGDVNVAADSAVVDTTGTAPGTPTASTGCLSAEDVSRLVKLELREVSSDVRAGDESMTCTYQAGDITLTITRAAESAAAQTFDQMTASAQTLIGATAMVDSVRIGERGISYVSKTKSEAAVVGNGRLYRAEITATSPESDVGSMRGPLVSLLENLLNRR